MGIKNQRASGKEENAKLELVLDKEVKESVSDKFGHSDYSRILSEMIQNHEGSFSIGLLGPWGVGKSTVKEIYCDELKNSGDKKSIKTITFNAWKYGGDDLKRALLMHVIKVLSNGNDQVIQLYKEQVDDSVEDQKDIPQSLKQMARDTVVFLGQNLKLLILILVTSLVSGLVLTLFSPQKGLISILLGTVGAYIIKSWNSKDHKLTLYKKKKVTKPPLTGSSQYEEVLHTYLDKYIKSNKSLRKIVIFIDDLDRLSPTEMVSGIDAIRVFMEMDINKKSLDKGFEGFVFVVSCDEEKVAKALIPRTRIVDGDSELPGSVSSIQDAKDFLDRIFQFRLEIASVPKEDLRIYSEQLMKENEIVVSALKNTDESLTNIIYRLIHSDVENPRNAKQLINGFLQALWIAKKREAKNPNELGSVSEGYITSRLEFLAFISAIRINYNAFYQCVLIEPKIIQTFFELFVSSNKITVEGEKLKSLSENERLMLQKMIRKSVDPDIYTLIDQYLPLRNYLSANRDIDIPSNIRPFVLMNQEKIEKEIGDYSKLLNALKAGDSYSVLRELGEPVEVKPLRESSIDALSKLLESTFISSANPIEKSNAGIVLSDLLKRLDASNDNRKLCSYLSYMFTNNERARDSIKVMDLLHNLALFESSSLEGVGKTLIDDYLGSEEIIFERYKNQGADYVNKQFNYVLKILFDISDMLDYMDFDNRLRTAIHDKINITVFDSRRNDFRVDGELLIDLVSKKWGVQFIFEVVKALEGNLENKCLGIGRGISKILTSICDKEVLSSDEFAGMKEIAPIILDAEIKDILEPIKRFVVKYRKELSSVGLEKIESICLNKVNHYYSNGEDQQPPQGPMRQEEYLSIIYTFVKEGLANTTEILKLINDLNLGQMEYVEEGLVDIVSLIIPNHVDELNTLMTTWANDINRNKQSCSLAIKRCMFVNIEFLPQSLKKLLVNSLKTYPNNHLYFNQEERVTTARAWFEYIPDHMISDNEVLSVFKEFISHLNPQSHSDFANNTNNKALVSNYIEIVIEMFTSRLVLIANGGLQDELITVLPQLRSYLMSQYFNLFKRMKNKWATPGSSSKVYTSDKVLTEAYNGAGTAGPETQRITVLDSAFTVPGEGKEVDKWRVHILERLLQFTNSHIDEVLEVIDQQETLPKLSYGSLVPIMETIKYKDMSESSKEKYAKILERITRSYNEAEDFAFIKAIASKLSPEYTRFVLNQIPLYNEAYVKILENHDDQDFTEEIMGRALDFLIELADDEENELFSHSDLLKVLHVTLGYASKNKYKILTDNIYSYLGDLSDSEKVLDEETIKEVLVHLRGTINSNQIGALLDFMEFIGLEKFSGSANFKDVINSLSEEGRRLFEKKFKGHF